MDVLEEVMEQIDDDETCRDIYMAGDFNIDFSRDSVEKRLLVEVLAAFNLYATTAEHRRTVEQSSTCIDNIFTNVESKCLEINVRNFHMK